MKFKRIAALVAALIMALSVMAACGQVPDVPVEGPAGTIDPSVTNVPANTVAPPVTTEPTTTPAPTTTEPTTTPAPTTTPPTTTTPAMTTTEATTKKDPNEFTVESMSATMYATMSLNVRKGPSTDFDRLGALAAGEAVTVTGRASTGWYQVSFKGQTGYVSNIYMSATPISDTPKTTGGDSDTESVPDGDSEIVDDEPGQTQPAPSSNPSSSATPAFTSGEWVKNNGATYMYSLFKEDRFKQALDKLAGAVEVMAPSVSMSEYLSSEECMDIAQDIAQIVGTGYCYFDQVSSISGTTMYLRYYCDNLDQANALMANLNAAGDRVVNAISGLSNYDKVRYIYEWITKNASYEHGSYYASAYGPICDGCGTCMGYAKACFYLLSRAGFNCVYCGGIGEEEGHMWVKVYLDGDWYNIDQGWSDPKTPTSVDPSYVDYAFLLVSDKYMRNTRTSVYDLSKYYSMPAADSDSNSWYARNGLVAGSLSEAEKLIKSGVSNALSKANGAQYLYVRVELASEDLWQQCYDTYNGQYVYDTYLKGKNTGYTFDTRLSDIKNDVKRTRTIVYRLVKQ